MVEAWPLAFGRRLILFHKDDVLLAALQQDQPDQLILERLLPGMSGRVLLYSLCRYPTWMLQVDMDQLQRVLHSLVDNALEHGSGYALTRAPTVPGSFF